MSAMVQLTTKCHFLCPTKRRTEQVMDVREVNGDLTDPLDEEKLSSSYSL